MGRLLLLNAIGIILVLGGIYLATLNVAGWGWLIFLGSIRTIFTSIKITTNKSEKDKD